MEGLNYFAAVAAAVSAFLLGGLWYSPVLFGNKWMKLAGLTLEQCKQGTAMVFGGAFVLSLISAFVFAMFLGPQPELKFALFAGFSAGLAWVAASLGISYLFERRPFALFAINGGYHTLQFTLYGLILGLWH